MAHEKNTGTLDNGQNRSNLHICRLPIEPSILIHGSIKGKAKSKTPNSSLKKPSIFLFIDLFASYVIKNQKGTPQERPKSTPAVIVIVAHSTSFLDLDGNGKE